jgi:hypothetical protein
MKNSDMALQPIVTSLLNRPSQMRHRIVRLVQTADPITLAGVLLLLEQVNKQKQIRNLYKSLVVKPKGKAG